MNSSDKIVTDYSLVIDNDGIKWLVSNMLPPEERSYFPCQHCDAYIDVTARKDEYKNKWIGFTCDECNSVVNLPGVLI